MQIRRLLLSALFSTLSTMALVSTLAATPSDGHPAPGSRLTPLQVDPYGDRDPLDAFHEWRSLNHVTLPVTPLVLQAHEDWVLNHPIDESHRAVPRPGVPEATAGSNLCPANGVSAYQGEMTIAINPNNANQMVAGANTFYQDPSAACQAPAGTTYGTQALYGSGDGGSTWAYSCAPWPSNDTGSVGTIMFGSDPTVAWDTNNNAYAVYMLVSQNSVGTKVSGSIVISKSTNVGATWTGLGVIVNNLTNSAVFDDKELMAIDTTVGQAYSHTNRIYVIWDENNNERVAYSDNGTTWTTVVLENTGSDIGGDLAIGADGTVYAVWNRTATSGDTLVFAKSTNGGGSWSAPAAISTHALSSFPPTGSTQNLPPAQDKRGINAFSAIAVDNSSASPYKGTLYVVYNDFPSGTSSGTNINIYAMASTNGGTTWGSPVKVNDDTGTATHFFPWVAVDQSNGYVNVSWYDTRNDTSNRKTQIYFAQSTNGGAGFSANVKVSAASSAFSNATIDYSDENSSDNTKYNGNQYGDYHQLAAAAGAAHIFWTDSRQFYPSNTTNANAEDAAAATVGYATTPTYTISGTVSSSGGGTLAGVTVSTTGASATTDGSGNYTLTGLANGTYTVTPSLTGYTFSPASQSVTVNGANVTGIGFTASPVPTYSISGTVTLSAGGGLSGVNVTAGSSSTVTDTSGNYTITGFLDGTYTVTPSLTGYTFTPASQSATVNGANVTGVNFTAAVSTGPTNRLQDGDFEGGLYGSSTAGASGTTGPWSWTSTGNSNPIQNYGALAYAGTWLANLMGFGSTQTETLQQKVIIPTNATVATLTFYLKVATAETSTRKAYDKLTVVLVDGGGVSHTLATYSNLNKSSTYAQKSFNVLTYKGQTVTIRFKGTEDSSLATSFEVDNVALTADGNKIKPPR